jgi:hypothetical protein
MTDIKQEKTIEYPCEARNDTYARQILAENQLLRRIRVCAFRILRLPPMTCFPAAEVYPTLEIRRGF